MEGTMLRRHRDGLVRDGENADQALDRMIAETRATARQRSSPPDSHAVRRLRPADEQGRREGNPESEPRGEGSQGVRRTCRCRISRRPTWIVSWFSGSWWSGTGGSLSPTVFLMESLEDLMSCRASGLAGGP